MVEFILVEADDLKVDTVVVAVTFDTLFSPGFGRSMVAFVVIDAGFEFGVTSQAFCIGYLITKGMAFGTIRQSLQMRVRRNQFPG